MYEIMARVFPILAGLPPGSGKYLVAGLQLLLLGVKLSLLMKRKKGVVSLIFRLYKHNFYILNINLT